MPPYQNLTLEKRERLRTALLTEKARRQALRERKSLAEDSLIEFIRLMWHVVEPARPLVEGWPLEAICEHLEAVTFGEITRLIINVPPGFTKALDHDTQVFTTWGWKRHGDLVVGDFVFGADGKPKRVLGCSEEMIKEAYDVRFDDGTSIITGEDHLWEIERDVMSVPPRYKRGRKPMTVRTVDLRPSGVQKGKVPLKPDRITVCQAVEMPPKRLLIDPYVLGAWLGDGGSDGGTIYAGEQDAHQFAKLGRIAAILPAGEAGRKQAFYHIRIQGLSKRLRILGLIRNKHIPQDYLEASAEQRWELLRGLMDTDGCATKEGYCSFSNKSERLATAVQRLAQSLGLKAFRTSHRAKLNGVDYGEHWLVGFTATAGMRVFNLARKQERVRGNQNARSRYRFVTSVTRLGQRPMKCIQVEDSLYLASHALVPTHNSLTTDVFWPAWEWGPCRLPSMRYIAASYSKDLTVRDNIRFRRVIMSATYRDLWGDIFGPSAEQFNIVKVTNDQTGWKLATSVGGIGTGERADRIVIDDANNVLQAESEAVLETTNMWLREVMPDRLNSQRDSAIVNIQQRTSGLDASGTLLGIDGADYVHLMIPMRYEPERHCATRIGWTDPRSIDGELAWVERIPPAQVDELEAVKGPYAFSGQYQQRPSARGGGIFKRDWWQLWDADEAKLYGREAGQFPKFIYVLGSLDSAFTEDESNDPSALTIWGVFQHRQTKRPRIMLVHAWRKWLEMHGPCPLQEPDEPERDYLRRCEALLPRKPGETINLYRDRVQKGWGLVEWTAATCRRFKVHHLLIEGKASGMTAAQELQRIHGREGWGITAQKVDPLSKFARALAVQPIWSQGLVWAPSRDWAEEVIVEMSDFPKGAHDDYTDSATQAAHHLREVGFAKRDEEAKAQDDDAAKRPEKLKPLYPV